MNLALKRHYGTHVLILGILGVTALVAFIPVVERFQWLINPIWISSIAVGVTALALGAWQLSGMKASRVDPTGKRSTRVGMTLGAVTTLAWVVLFAWAGYMTKQMFANATYTITPAAGAIRSITTFHSGEVETEGHEVLSTDGEWRKDGHFVRFLQAPRRIKLEEGNYHEGKRDGAWTFWRDDGSVDEARSGFYKDDVRMSDDATAR
jgi:succinate dehydrogenase hydrophobic anchor subunit